MSANPLSEERQMIPRWRSFRRSNLGHDLRPLKAPQGRPNADLEPLRSESRSSNNEWVLADFLSALIASGEHADEQREVASRMMRISRDPVLGAWASDIEARVSATPGTAEGGLPEDAKDRAMRAVPRLRRRLVERPADVVARVDLALAHLVLGNRDSARKQMFSALQLGSASRFVVRGAATLFTTLEEPDLGYWALTSTDLHQRDPWVMASALALADLAERKLDVRSARELLVRGNFGPSDTSELTSELGTLEVISGKRSRARQLFSQSLERPNDNTLAQARWAFDELQLDLDFEGKATNGAFEAQLRAHVKNGEWDAAYLAGIWWQRDQSFSQAAALSTSFVAAIGLENYEAALQAAKIGMRANPTDGGLRNNAAFAAAQLGRLTEAESYLAVATATDDVDQVHTVEATRGLIAFRSGKVIAGREYYKSARDGFRSLGLPYQNVMALLHWATEEVRIHSASAIELVKAAADAVARYPTAEGQLLLVRLQEKTAIE